MLDTDALPSVLKVTDLQRLLRLSRGATYDLVKTPGFPVLHVGRVLRVPRDAFLRWLEAHAQAGTPGEGR